MTPALAGAPPHMEIGAPASGPIRRDLGPASRSRLAQLDYAAIVEPRVPMYETIESWLRVAARSIHEQSARLTSLDQAIGDGDHGTNLDRGFSAIVTALDARGSVAGPPSDPTVTADTLRLAGRTLISTVGGASGPLYGTAFLRSAAAVGQADPSATSGAILAAALDAASEGVAALGKSTTGEKTMLDALVPAAAAARSAAAAGGDAPAVAAAARDAAAAGAEATIPMLATKGRASYLGERSIGHQDPGATSLSILLGALADSIG